MLPFLKKKQEGSVSGVIVKHRQPDEKPQEDQEDSKEGHRACARALIDAIKAENVQGVVDAMQDMFEIMELEPHEEGPHIEPHSYESQNIKAAKE